MINLTLDNKTTGQDIYATAMKDSDFTQNVIESLKGNAEGLDVWTPNTITFYNYTLDDPTREPISAEAYNAHQNAINFFQDKFVAPNGQTYVTLLPRQEGTTFPNPIENYAIVRQKSDVGPGNVKNYIGTNLFDAIDARARAPQIDNWNTIISEVLEGLANRDTESGSNTFSFTVDQNNQINGFSYDGKVVWNTDWTYKPGIFK